MSPMKGESCSCHKGKVVATDDPLTETMGGEALHSESDYFEEEEGGRNPGNECLPLIDP